MKCALIIFFSFLVFSCGKYGGDIVYSNVGGISEADIYLDYYLPFSEDTKAVVMDEPSTLKFETDMPKLDGAIALYPLYSAFAQAVYPNKMYNLYESEVACHNTITSYKLLIDKKADIIFVAPPSTEQLEMAEKSAVEFRYTPIGKEAFVFFVNVQNPVDSLTVEQLRGIYSGEITNWKQVGGNEEPIQPFQRNANSGSQTAFLQFMQGKPIIDPLQENVARGMMAVISQTADYVNHKNAIGFSFRFYANEMVGSDDVKLLKINGVYPDLKGIKNGSYPLSSEFFAITLQANNKPNVQALLNWITSEQGQSIVEKTGYCPLFTW